MCSILKERQKFLTCNNMVSAEGSLSPSARSCGVCFIEQELGGTGGEFLLFSEHLTASKPQKEGTNTLCMNYPFEHLQYHGRLDFLFSLFKISE